MSVAGFLERLSPRDRRALRVGSALMAAALVWTLAVSPYLRASRDAATRLDERSGLLTRELRLVADAARLPAVAREGERRLTALTPRLLGGESAASASAALAAYVRDGARAGPLLLGEVKPLPVEPSGAGVNAVSLRVSGEGDLEGLLTLLRALESGTKLVHVDQLEIDAGPSAAHPGAKGPEVLTFQLTVKGFTLAPDTPRSPAREPRAPGGDAPVDTRTADVGGVPEVARR